MDNEIIEKAKKVKLLLLDVDGVLTDGRIIYDSKGREIKFFYVHDGMGVYLLKKAGIPTVLVTAKGSSAIKPRARDMQVEAVFENVSPKTSILDKILKRFKVEPEEICFVGDDLVDLGLMKRVGFRVAVFNACSEIKSLAHYITLKEAGKGAVREIAEIILKAKGVWEALVKEYEI
jgi:3-deoxy-D-manno-octulosonate 8-phosphate phosphatase (KDO 8-P phosphatase)